jgi:CheY-like chemotaxis protein
MTPKRILVVDDEADLVEYLRDELETAGYQTAGASDGVEAVLRVLDGGIDVVLMDIRMPRLDGINALRIIRRAAPHLPVVTFTGQAGQGDMAASTQLGAFTCLVKPISIQKLIDTLERILPHP